MASSVSALSLEKAELCSKTQDGLPASSFPLTSPASKSARPTCPSVVSIPVKDAILLVRKRLRVELTDGLDHIEGRFRSCIRKTEQRARAEDQGRKERLERWSDQISQLLCGWTETVKAQMEKTNAGVHDIDCRLFDIMLELQALVSEMQDSDRYQCREMRDELNTANITALSKLLDEIGFECQGLLETTLKGHKETLLGIQTCQGQCLPPITGFSKEAEELLLVEEVIPDYEPQDSEGRKKGEKGGNCTGVLEEDQTEPVAEVVDFFLQPQLLFI